MNIQPISREKIKILLIIMMLFIVTGVFAQYYIRKMTTEDIVIDDLKIDSGAIMLLRQMQQTSSRNGTDEWTLTAESARILKDKDQALLDDVHAIFFLENNDKINLTSKHGRLDTKSHDMTLSGNVIVRQLNSTLKTDELHYEKKRHIIYSNSGITLKDGNSAVTADSMIIELNRERVIFKGRVNALFDTSTHLFSNTNK